MARAALAATRVGTEGDDLLEAKVVTARFYASNVLPEVHGLLPAVLAGKDDLMAIEADALAR